MQLTHSFDIITPVFEDALPSLQLVARELKMQTFPHWHWMLCNNGDSEKIREFIDHENDPRFIFVEFPFEETPDIESIIHNSCKRRDFCLQQSAADYIIMLDADIKILDKNYLNILSHSIKQNQGGRIFFYNILHPAGAPSLPIIPIQYGKIDLANYCVEKVLAASVGFPFEIRLDEEGYQHKDYVFIEKLLNETARTAIYIDTAPLLEWNGNNSYKNLSTILEPIKNSFILKLINILS